MKIERFGKNITTIAATPALDSMSMAWALGSVVKPEDRLSLSIHTDEKVPGCPEDTVSFRVTLDREEVDRIVEFAAVQPRISERNPDTNKARPEKSKASRTYDALRQLQGEFPQHEGMSKAIDEFLASARPGTLMRLHDIVTGSATKAEALEKLGA